MSTKIKNLPYFFLLFILFFSCRKSPLDFQSDQSKTLASFRKIDNFPLYFLKFYGDYGADEYLSFLDSRERFKIEYRDQHWACTCFCTKNQTGEVIFGRNFDWYTHPALILFTNPPNGYASVSMVDISYLGFDLTDPAEQDLQRLLDVPSIPFDGMNEHGLTVGMMAVPSANGFLNSNNPAIGSLMAIRLMLDYTKTLSQALDLLKNYNIDFQGGPAVHYLISDASGKSAIVEYLEEGLMVTWGQNNRQVCTNFIMANEKPEDANSSCWRYNTALSTLNNNEGNLNISDVMSLLKNVSQSNTIWTTVYNQSTREVFVVMGKKYQEMSTFNLNEIWSQDG